MKKNKNDTLIKLTIAKEMLNYMKPLYDILSKLSNELINESKKNQKVRRK